MKRPVRFRASPEDFKVDEIPLYLASGEGDHTFVKVRKRLRTSEAVARQLARAAGVSSGEVGYAGRKDRKALTTQWMSVPGLDPTAALEVELDGAEILEAVRHPHKLRTGQLKGNRFEIILRGVGDDAESYARSRLDEIGVCGMPNRFGVQRFGHGGRNADRGRALLAGEKSLRDRRKARFMISALQAEVFNRVLEQRPVSLDAVEAGDVAQVCDSGGLFLVEDVEIERARAASFEISATGPIFGKKMKSPAGLVAEREIRVAQELGMPTGGDLRPPSGVRVPGTRRPVRVRVGQPRLSREADRLTLCFSLPAGSYATVLLEELFADLEEGAG